MQSETNKLKWRLEEDFNSVSPDNTNKCKEHRIINKAKNADI